MIAASVMVITLVFIGGVSVVGLLQSTERVGSSGIVVQPPPPPPPPPPSSPPPSPPPEPDIEIDVYGDAACTQVISSVGWGEIEAGSSATRDIWVKNNGDDSVSLSLLTENWNPSGASNYIQLSWDYDGGTIVSGEVRQITLTLSVSSSASGIDGFSFDIVIIGSAL
jgi:hypothetical protein